MKSILFLFIFPFFSLFILSCSSDSGNYKKNASILYTPPKSIPLPWKQISAEGSDYALFNEKTKSLFFFNSACRKNDFSNLSSLSSSILAGIEDLIIIKKIFFLFQEREAIDIIAQGKTDGVTRFFKVITVQKNYCIYDYALISKDLHNLEDDSPFFNSFSQRIILN